MYSILHNDVYCLEKLQVACSLGLSGVWYSPEYTDQDVSWSLPSRNPVYSYEWYVSR